jgi:hypothetical protein
MDEFMMRSVRTRLRSCSSTVMSLLLTGASLLVQSLDRTLSLRLSPWFIVSLINPYLDAYGTPKLRSLQQVQGGDQ